MRKVGVLAIVALVFSLLLAGIAFANEKTLPGEDNFLSAQVSTTPGYDSAGMMIGNQMQANTIGEESGQVLNESSLNLFEHYGEAPAWGGETNNHAVPPDKIGFGVVDGVIGKTHP